MKYLNFLKKNKCIILILLVAAILRLYRLDFQSVWLDEIYSMKISNPDWSFSKLITEVNEKEGFPYIYFITLKLMHIVFGYTPIVARMFSVIFGILGVFMIYKFGKLLFNKNVGLIAAVIACFNEYSILVSQEARPYSFYLFSVIVSFYFLVKFLKNINLRNAIIYGLSCALMLNTNFFSLVNLFSQYILLLIFLFLIESQERKVFFKYSLYSGLIALILYIPNYKILEKIVGFESGWIPAPTTDSLSIIFKDLMGTSEITLFIITPLFFYYLIDIFSSKDITFKYRQFVTERKVFAFVILGVWLAVLVGCNYLKSYMDTSIMITRYFISILPVFIIIIAAGINLITNRIIKAFILSLLCFAMFSNLVSVKHFYTEPYKTQFREAALFVNENNIESEPVYTSLKFFFDYFFDEGKKFKVEERQSLELLLNEMQSDTTKIKTFWYVDAHNRPYSLSENTTSFSENVFIVDKSFDGMDSWAKHYVVKSNKVVAIDISKGYNNEEKIKAWIEQFEQNDTELIIKGWAFIEGVDAINSKIEIVILKDNKAVIVPTTMYNRDDISKSEKNGLNLDNTGFSVKMDVESLDKGDYLIGIKIENVKVGKKSILLTEKNITVK